jgi:X-Pro dipeptidyl-peptidase
MRHFVAAIVPFLLFPGLANAQNDAPAKPAKATPVFENGEAMTVDAFKDRKEWIREWLFVEAPFDSDKDGKNDRLHVDVTRPKQTDSEGLKVPAVYETSPYFAGTGPHDLGYYWDVKQELGAPSPKRAAMKPIPFGGEPGMISQSEVVRWLQRGYAVVHSCSPGTGYSQGCPDVGGPAEVGAPKAVIDWLNGRAKGYKTVDGKEEVKATWCTGKVGMLGTSYNGGLPIAAAHTGVEGLAAIIPMSPPSSWYRYYRSQGLVRSPGGYLGEDMDVLFDFIASCEPKRREKCIQLYRDTELLKGMERSSGDFNDFWDVRDYLSHLDKYTCPTLAVHGLSDWNVMPDQSIELFVRLRQKGVTTMLFLHQGGHGGEPPFALMNRWFTRFLFGVENGVEEEAKAWVVREGKRPSQADKYADFPHPDAKLVTLLPQAGGAGVGALAMQPAIGTETFTDDVAHAGGKLASAEKSDHRLLWATPVLSEPLHLSGTAKLRIKLAADEPATNLSVWLVSLPWTDARRITDDLVTRGWADPQNAKSLRKGTPLVAGEFVEVEVELQPDDQVIAAGERLGLMVFASDREFTLWPKPGTKVTVDLAGTALTLPIVGGAEAFAKATQAADAKR